MSEIKTSVYNHTDTLAGAIASLRSQGNIKEFTAAVKYVQTKLDLPTEVVDQWVAKAEQEAPKIRHTLGSGLKEIAERNGCSFDFRPPYISFGCVMLHERIPETWDLSVLDGVVIESLSTQDAASLSGAALTQINRIQEALSKEEPFAKGLIAAYNWLRQAKTKPEDRFVAPNLLMVLCTYGKGLRKQLTSAVSTTPVSPLSRAEFSYLLARVRSRAMAGVKGFPKLEFHGATQLVTKDPSRFISIPNQDDPHQTTHSDPIAGIALEQLGG